MYIQGPVSQALIVWYAIYVDYLTTSRTSSKSRRGKVRMEILGFGFREGGTTLLQWKNFCCGYRIYWYIEHRISERGIMQGRVVGCCLRLILLGIHQQTVSSPTVSDSASLEFLMGRRWTKNTAIHSCCNILPWAWKKWKQRDPKMKDKNKYEYNCAVS